MPHKHEALRNKMTELMVRAPVKAKFHLRPFGSQLFIKNHYVFHLRPYIIFCTQLVTTSLFRGVVVPFLSLRCKMIKYSVSLIAKIEVNKLIKLRIRERSSLLSTDSYFNCISKRSRFQMI